MPFSKNIEGFINFLKRLSIFQFSLSCFSEAPVFPSLPHLICGLIPFSVYLSMLLEPSQQSSPPRTSDLYPLYVTSACTWFVLPVLYGWLFKTKILTRHVNYLREGKFSWFSSQHFPSLYDEGKYFLHFTIIALSKFLILKTSKEKTLITATPPHFKCFILCKPHFNSTKHELLSPYTNGKKKKKKPWRFALICSESQSHQLAEPGHECRDI